MTSGQIGYLVGAFLACGGAAYILLGFLWIIRVYKRWPRFSGWIAVAFAALLGVMTYGAAQDSIALVGSFGAAAFIVWRERKTLFPKAEPER